MATTSNYYQSTSKKPRFEESKSAVRKIWACLNPLIGQCQEHDYDNDHLMLNEKKIEYYDEEKICRQKCGLPRDLLNLVLQHTGQKGRSTLRESGKSIQSLFPIKESKKENQDRLLYNELMSQCFNFKKMDESKFRGKKDYLERAQMKLLNNHQIDKELLLLLFSAAIENNCTILFNNLLNSTNSINELIPEDWSIIVRKILDSNNSNYFLNKLVIDKFVKLEFVRE
jgi:hypothetical protein